MSECPALTTDVQHAVAVCSIIVNYWLPRDSTSTTLAVEGIAGTGRHLNDVHGSVAKGLGILLHLSKPSSIATHEVQLCLFILHIAMSSVLARALLVKPAGQSEIHTVFVVYLGNAVKW